MNQPLLDEKCLATKLCARPSRCPRSFSRDDKTTVGADGCRPRTTCHSSAQRILAISTGPSPSWVPQRRVCDDDAYPSASSNLTPSPVHPHTHPSSRCHLGPGLNSPLSQRVELDPSRALGRVAYGVDESYQFQTKPPLPASWPSARRPDGRPRSRRAPYKASPPGYAHPEVFA